MRHLPELFDANRRWAEQLRSRDPLYFERLCGLQRPKYLWIGCADSRVPANSIIGLEPGEVFVHRNIANLVNPDDTNCMAVLQYAINVLAVEHVIVCGHYGCGGVQAAMGPDVENPLEDWLSPLRQLVRASGSEEGTPPPSPNSRAHWYGLCERNVTRQVEVLDSLPVVQAARDRGQPLSLHGWIYDLHDGLLRDLRTA
ncbi:MAG: carbonic anhydrase [Steroidobacteraceae bacterium]